MLFYGACRMDAAIVIIGRLQVSWISFCRLHSYATPRPAAVTKAPMDTPAVSKVLRRLFSHETCSRIKYQPSLYRHATTRQFSGASCLAVASPSIKASNQDSNWQQRSDLLPLDKSHEFEKYPLLTAVNLRNRKQRPRRVKMLMRDFIEGVLTTRELLSY
jgi:hypothetical protein